MKIWTSIIVAGAILALAVPSAFAARTAIPADSGIGPGYVLHAPTKQQLVALHTRRQDLQIKALIAKNTKLVAKNQKLAADNLAQLATIGNLNSQIWTLTHQNDAGGTVPAVDPDQDCIDYGLCTTEQNCKYWGNDCQYVTTTPATDAAREASSSEGGSQG